MEAATYEVIKKGWEKGYRIEDVYQFLSTGKAPFSIGMDTSLEDIRVVYADLYCEADEKYCAKPWQ
jgi:hypothetical protein